MTSTQNIGAILLSWAYAAIAYLLGGVDNLFISLIIFMCVDYLTGLMYAAETHDLASKKSFRGIAKKAAMLMTIVVAHQLDIVMGAPGNWMRNTMITFLVATEGISIIENAGKLGVRFPRIMQDAFGLFKTDFAETRKKTSSKGGENDEEDKK